ncbi:MAG: tryptophan--tRNA ligase [Eubacteriales bacterium]|nr:tryptophan--tRNA ligase [Eubacteriales bacterium]
MAEDKKTDKFSHLGDIVLTGDRPSGRLHIGHYAGSIQKRLEFQDQYDQNFIMIADMQALTDHAAGGEAVSQSVMQLAIDYLAVGLDPRKSTIFIQSLVPELTELTVLYMNFVTLARLKRNPTVKNEMQQKGFGDTVPIGFLNYPVSQAADITAFMANLVPVGNDQLPMIEQTNEIVRSINYTYQTEVLRECEAIMSKTGRLPGTDGSAKMSKTIGNCIYLSDDEKTVKEKVMGMYTDPGHLRVEDPGKVEGNPVFTYLKTFDPDQGLVADMADHYQRGGLGDVKVKRHLLEVMQDLLTPIRERRAEFEQDQGQILTMLKENSAHASAVARETLERLKKAMSLNY